MPLSCRAARLNNGRANRSPTTTRQARRSQKMQALNRQWLTSRSRRRVISATLSEANPIGRSPRRPHVWTRARRQPLTLQRSQQQRRERQRPARKSRRTSRRPTVRRRCCMACQYPPRLPLRGESVTPFSQPRGHCSHWVRVFPTLLVSRLRACDVTPCSVVRLRPHSSCDAHETQRAGGLGDHGEPAGIRDVDSHDDPGLCLPSGSDPGHNKRARCDIPAPCSDPLA